MWITSRASILRMILVIDVELNCTTKSSDMNHPKWWNGRYEQFFCRYKQWATIESCHAQTSTAIALGMWVPIHANVLHVILKVYGWCHSCRLDCNTQPFLGKMFTIKMIERRKFSSLCELWPPSVHIDFGFHVPAQLRHPYFTWCGGIVANRTK